MFWVPLVNEALPVIILPAPIENSSKATPAEAKFYPAQSISSYFASFVPGYISVLKWRDD
jgi:hypothetical protein